jgi:hypothetical protein
MSLCVEVEGVESESCSDDADACVPTAPALPETESRTRQFVRELCPFLAVALQFFLIIRLVQRF